MKRSLMQRVDLLVRDGLEHAKKYIHGRDILEYYNDARLCALALINELTFCDYLNQQEKLESIQEILLAEKLARQVLADNITRNTVGGLKV